MNADSTPMNADKAIFVNEMGGSSASAKTEPIGAAHPDKKSSAFIGVESAFIGVPKNFAGVTP
ncbi:MAG TPA: hypothetical protein PLD37_04315 [Usitatibacteraceae bacterium]|nr:hypothetical protein [Usitatibacteraceae bacterium]